jgi:hypothetical protein
MNRKQMKEEEKKKVKCRKASKMRKINFKKTNSAAIELGNLLT